MYFPDRLPATDRPRRMPAYTRRPLTTADRVALAALFGAAAGAVATVTASAFYCEIFRPIVFPTVPGRGHGFDAVGMMLYLFGTPLGAILGAAVGIWRAITASPLTIARPGLAPLPPTTGG